MTVLDETAIDQLAARAQAVMHRAYAPYSRFRVGAALLASDGRVFEGCNVENVSFPVTLCAERSALAAAVANGARAFVAVAIATEAEHPTPPCGMCRQALLEFAPALAIVSVDAAGGQARWTLDALLPEAFSPNWLDRP